MQVLQLNNGRKTHSHPTCLPPACFRTCRIADRRRNSQQSVLVMNNSLSPEQPFLTWSFYTSLFAGCCSGWSLLTGFLVRTAIRSGQAHAAALHTLSHPLSLSLVSPSPADLGANWRESAQYARSLVTMTAVVAIEVSQFSSPLVLGFPIVEHLLLIHLQRPASGPGSCFLLCPLSPRDRVLHCEPWRNYHVFPTSTSGRACGVLEPSRFFPAALCRTVRRCFTLSLFLHVCAPPFRGVCLS